MDVLRTLDATSPLPPTLLESRGDNDQPFVQAMTVFAAGPDEGKDRIYVGNNDFSVWPGQTATVDLCLDGMGGAPFSQARVDSRSTGTAGQDAPSVRTALHDDGTVYAAFMGWRAADFATGTITSDVVVVRDDAWAAAMNPFQDLTDPGDGLAGMRVVTGRKIMWAKPLGQERTGSHITISVDPNNSSRVFLAWCDEQPAGYTLHVRSSLNRGLDWSPADLLTVERATNPSLAINEDGKVGLLYQQLTGLPGTQRWESHFRLTNGGVTWDNYVLSTAPADQPTKNPFYGTYLGDYSYLTAVGKEFRGIFTANNAPDQANFPQGVVYQRNADFITHQLLGLGGTTIVPISMDPFFFKVTDEAPVETAAPAAVDECAVQMPGIRPECVSPAAPPWVPFSTCLDWYETRYVREGDILFRIIYQHCLRMIGRQQGPLLYTVTLLPLEKLKIFHYERYRRTRAATELYSVHTSFRQSIAAVHQSRVAKSTSKYEEFLDDLRTNGDTNVSVGGELFPVSWDSRGDANLHFFQSASAQQASDDFTETAQVASQQVDAERSIVVSTSEDKETQDATAREIENKNGCRAVTYFIRRVNEVYQLVTTVWSVSFMVPGRGSRIPGISAESTQWRSIADLGGLNEKMLAPIQRSAAMLPKPGQTVEAPIQITLPTDGVVYEAELAHCSSCEPAREVTVRLELERTNAESRKACFEAELVELEVQRRRLLLQQGNLLPFDTTKP